MMAPTTTTTTRTRTRTVARALAALVLAMLLASSLAPTTATAVVVGTPPATTTPTNTRHGLIVTAAAAVQRKGSNSNGNTFGSSSNSNGHYSTQQHHHHHSSTLCPSSPMCSRAGAASALRRRYCQSPLSRLASYLKSIPSILSGGRGHDKKDKNSVAEMPYHRDVQLRAHAGRELEQLLAGNLFGQPHLTAPLLAALRRKLNVPSEPLVLHLAGDNGVGKTFTARLISLALSLRCAGDRGVCDTGDSLLSISGAGFDGMTVAAARRVIVRRVLAHVRRYPHGIVLIDDFTAMDPALTPLLAPLFGRAAYYPEQFLGEGEDTLNDDDDSNSNSDDDGKGGGGGALASSDKKQRPLNKRKRSPSSSPPPPHVKRANAAAEAPSSPPTPLGSLLVIVTTDLGKQGRTIGKSRSQIEQLVRDNFAELYGTLLPAHTRTFAYLPFTTEVAAAVVRGAVANLPCTVGVHAGRATTSGGGGSVDSNGDGGGGGIGRLFGRDSNGNGPVMSIVASGIDDTAVAFLVERHRGAWDGKENGHALRRAIEDELVMQVMQYQEEVGLDKRIVAQFAMDDTKMAVVLQKSGDGGGSGGEKFGHHHGESDL